MDDIQTRMALAQVLLGVIGIGLASEIGSWLIGKVKPQNRIYLVTFVVLLGRIFLIIEQALLEALKHSIK